ncbi:MAG: hypothetical protein IH901_05985 [Proteobacteria bacterium]|nr:hypothetical protein [Pseudomonadota bacterium]
MARQINKSEEKISKWRHLTPIRIVLMTALVFYLAYLTYRFFGVTDVWGWLQEVLMLVGILALVILAAAGVVAVLMVVRKKTRNF